MSYKNARRAKAAESAVRRRKGGIHIKPSHEGDLHSALGVPQDQPIPADKLAEAKNSSSPHMRKMATFAQNARSWKH